MTEYEPVLEEPCASSRRLFIIFGGISMGIALPPFEFFKASQILDENRIFIRDLKQAWYHLGLPGISRDIPTTCAYIQSLVEKYMPDELVMVGNSMGGFAAILFSALLGEGRAIAFAPQTFIGPLKRLAHLDRRWQRQMLTIYRNTVFRKRYFDLRSIRNIAGPSWRADVYVSQDHRLDVLHAQNIGQMPGVNVHICPGGGHTLVRQLRDEGRLRDILLGVDAP